MKKINLKKIFVTFALLAIIVPESFTVIACKKSGPLSEKEQALQALRDFSRAGDWTDEIYQQWAGLWFNYFEALKYEILFSTFKFTQTELANNTLLQNNILNTMETVVQSDIQKWNVPKEYEADSLIISYRLFRLENTEQVIVILGSLSLFIINPKDSNNHVPYDTSFSGGLRYEIVN